MNIEKILHEKYLINHNDVSPIVLNGVVRVNGTRRITRNDFVNIFREIGFKYGAEIGVRKGAFSCIMLNAMNDGKLLLVDPWIAHEGISSRKNEIIYQEAKKMLKNNFGDSAIIKRMTSVEAAKDVKDDSLDFVYIDARHDFDSAVEDIITWTPKVRNNGIVFGHDYYNGPGFGVIEAINAYTKCHKIYPLYLTREEVPSWIFIKK